MIGKKKMKRLLLSGTLSCLIIGTVLLRFPVPQSSAETVLESVALETREVKTSYNTGFWIGLGAVALGGLVSVVIIQLRRKKDDDNE